MTRAFKSFHDQVNDHLTGTGPPSPRAGTITYGFFEAVGSCGTPIRRHDRRITTERPHGLTHILHLTELSRWRSGEDIDAESLRTQGFLHASPEEPTMLAVANTLYSEPVEPLVVLVVDTDLVDAEVRWEAADPGPPPGVDSDVLFPHVFGPIPRRAVVAVHHPVRDSWGRYIGLEETHSAG